MELAYLAFLKLCGIRKLYGGHTLRLVVLHVYDESNKLQV